MPRHETPRPGRRPAALFLLWTCAWAGPALGPEPVSALDSGWNETGEASWYGHEFAGRPTASGETYDPRNLTAAHKSLPLGCLVRVHNLANDRRMIVRINDRGPFVRGRVIDLSEAAAEVLGFKNTGVADVRITPVAAPPGKPVPKVWAQTARSEDPASPAAAVAPAGAAATAEAGPAGYYVQLGAYRDSRHANEQVQKAGPLGMALMVEYADGVYRVLAGPFESSAAAARAVSDLGRSGWSAFVRQD